ncbi:hypothetical protein [Agromyces ramosus]|uniref:Uncharacterized protein n=1 Tax=Agromyces ramosus TaxID=33879 RepID=A0ABU0RCN2_9MICO|nr:hypothetical protein [Agromyces ramosus]MDQ0895816.1 hypothetical protein [Agromyces ramosus]
MSDTVGAGAHRGDEFARRGGEYTDSELPLDAALPKEEYAEVEDVIDADELDDDTEVDTAEYDVEVVEIVEPDSDLPPDRQPPR